MLDFLDIRTLAFTTIIFSLCFGLGLIAYATTLSKFRMIYQIGLGVLFIGVSQLLLSLRGYIDDFISIIIANELLIIAFILIYYGLHKLCQSKLGINKNFIIFLLLFVFSSFSYYTYLEPSMKARIIIISYSVSLLCIHCAHVLFKYKIKAHYLPTRVLGTIFIITAIIELLTSIFDSKLSNVLGLSDLSDMHRLLYLAALLLITSIGFCVVWIVNLQLQDELKTLSEIDYLTKMNNRRSLENIATEELSRASRNNDSLSIILCDIDHFKQINDQYGHQAGDDILVNFSALIIKSLRDYDIAARYGGEEFLLLLPSTNIEQAMEVAGKLRVIIAQNKFTITDTNTLTVTASFGVTSNIEKSNNWDGMIKAADDALYEAKKLGRNQVLKG